MNTNWEQQPTNKNTIENNPSSSMGRPVNNYEDVQQQQYKQPGYNSSPMNGYNATSSSSEPASPGVAPQGRGDNTPKRSPMPRPFRANNLVGNTVQVMRNWTDKMATVAGNNVQPPAPPMERYRPPSASVAQMSPVAPGRTPPLRPAKTPPPPPWRRSRALRIAMQMRHRRERLQRVSPIGIRILTGVLITLLVLILVGSFSGSAYGYSYYQSQLPRLQQLAHQSISQTTRIYDRNGVLLYNAYDKGRRTPISFEDVPKVMQDAMIAAEDKDFWNNSGVDPVGIVRAGLGFVQKNSVQGGASTITQQVIKNLTGNKEVSLNRKIPEAALAIGLTQQYPKQKIMEMYFNISSFGSQDEGVEAAAQEYFGLKPNCDQHFKCVPAISQLDYNQATGKHDPILALARASLLAGMPQDPVGYDPTNGDAYKQRALGRQKDVLSLMITDGMSLGNKLVTPALARQAEDMTAHMTFTKFQSSKLCPNFVDWVIVQVASALGKGNYSVGLNVFKNAGFNIRTTIDSKLEDYVERAVKRHLTQPEYQTFLGDYGPLNSVHNVNDAAVVVMNAHTGEILAMDGSADYNSTDPRVNGNYNAASPLDGGTGRAPGSSFKPFVYATAFEMGWYPSMILPDFKTYFPNGKPQGTPIDQMYNPPDFSVAGDANYHHNYVSSTVRQSTAESLNVPAVKAMEYAGPENVLATVQRLGLTSIHNNGVSWGLGTDNATVLQMTGAYQTFANSGKRIPPQGILDIWDNYGHNLYHYDPASPSGVQIFSSQVSYMMTSVLMDEPARYGEFTIDHDLSFGDVDQTCIYQSECAHQVAAKTGTTDNYKDNWTMGYTPNAVVGVWAGNADNSSMYKVVGITGAAPIWHSVMETVSGYCGNRDDKIDCPSSDAKGFSKALGLDQQDTFPIPQTGLHKACTSAYNGLQGGGKCDWMIDGQDPLQGGGMLQPPKSNNDNNNGNGNNNNGNNNGNGNNG